MKSLCLAINLLYCRKLFNDTSKTVLKVYMSVQVVKLIKEDWPIEQKFHLKPYHQSTGVYI